MLYPDYPFAHHYYSINDLRLHYLDEGKQRGNVIVMLHGNPSWSFYYRKLVLALRDEYRCIVPDHMGMGLSSKPSSAHYQFTLSQRIDDLAALLEHLQITNDITLVLHDWGGIIGMALATRYPERIKRLVILNTTAFHLPHEKRIPWQIKISRLPLLGNILNQGFNLFARAALYKCLTRTRMSSAVAAAYLAPYDSWGNRYAIQAFIRDIPLSPAEPAYTIIDHMDKTIGQFKSIPMLICWGMQDFVFDHCFLKQWQQRFMHAELHCLQDVGHYILEDAPEQIIPLIQSFLQRHSLS